MIQNQENGEKLHFGPDLDPLDPNSDCQIFFFKILVFSVTRYQLSSYTISEKANDPILRKFSDGWTDRQMHRQTGESEFIGRCPNKVERTNKGENEFPYPHPNPHLSKSFPANTNLR